MQVTAGAGQSSAAAISSRLPTLHLSVLHVVFIGSQVTVFTALLVLDSRRLQQSRLDCLPCIVCSHCYAVSRPHLFVQVTVFMALLVLDSRRLQQSRLDCLPCIRVPYRDASGHWVYDDVSENEEDEHQGSTAAAAGTRPSWGLPGFGALRGLAGGGQQQGSASDPGEMYFAPQQQLPPASAAAAAGGVEFGEERLTPLPLPTVLPGVTKSGPGLLHGDKISLQSLLQVGVGWFGGTCYLICISFSWFGHWMHCVYSSMLCSTASTAQGAYCAAWGDQIGAGAAAW
jgi:hypothetical protein